MEFLLWLSGLRAQLISMRMWVQSLASLAVAAAVAAAALIQHLVWEPPYTARVAIKEKGKKKKEHILEYFHLYKVKYQQR